MGNSFQKQSDTIITTSFTYFLSKKPPVAVSRFTKIIQEHTSPQYMDFPSIWLCVKGKVTFLTENGEFPCTPGCVVIIPPGTMYFPKLIDKEFLFLQIYAEYNAYKDVDHPAYINSITHLLLPAFSRELGFVPTLAATLSPASLEKAKKLFEAPSLKNIEKFFTLPEFTLTSAQKETALSLVSSRLLPLLRAMTYIQENFALKITSDELVKISGLCRTHLFTVFKKYLGTSPTVYHIMTRVARAQYAISHTQYSFRYISDMCGFADLTHMSRCYKKYKGFSPKFDRARMKEYRKRYSYIHISHNHFFKE